MCARLHSLADLDILHACLKSQRQESSWMLLEEIGLYMEPGSVNVLICFSLDNVAAAMSPRWVRALFRQGGEEAC